MKCLNLFVIFIILFLKVCYTLTCQEAKNILNIDWIGDCCELQQFTCDDSKENILSIDILPLNEIESDVENNDEKLFSRSSESKSKSKSTKSKSTKSKSKSKSKGKKKSKSLHINYVCYVSKQTMSKCLTTCDTKTDANEKLACQNNCQITLKDSEECRESCEEIDQTTGKCLKFKDDTDSEEESAAYHIRMNTFLWIVAIILSLNFVY